MGKVMEKCKSEGKLPRTIFKKGGWRGGPGQKGVTPRRKRGYEKGRLRNSIKRRKIGRGPGGRFYQSGCYRSTNGRATFD